MKKSEHEAQKQEAERARDRQVRLPLQTRIEFIGDFDIVVANGVDLSEGGMCFELDEGLPFEMKFEIDGQAYRRRAQLIWVKRLPEGHYRFGFTFMPPKPFPIV